MTWWRRKTRPQSRGSDLDATILHWADGVPCSIRDAYENFFVTGAIGSGKSSGSVSVIVRALLAAQMGGLFHCVKRTDAADYVKMVVDSGREKDLVVYSPSNPLRFDFIASEREQCPDAVGLTENLTALVMSIAEVMSRSRSNRSGSENAEYFRQTAARVCRHGMLALILSRRGVSVPNLHRLILSSPRSRAEAHDPKWQQTAECYLALQAADLAPKSESQRADLALAVSFFLQEWAEMDPRTRSNVESTLTNVTEALSRGVVRDSLSAPEPNFFPSMLHDGRIVILDYPVLVHREIGQIIQTAVRYCCERAHSRRDLSQNGRGTFIVVDECQHLIVEEDQLFATTSRSTRTSLIFCTQSISTLLEAFGGKNAEAKMYSFLGCMQTQLHHQQADTRTISYIQELTGKSRQLLMNSSSQRNGDWMGPLFGEPSGGSAGFSETLDFDLQARDLNGLAKGGPPHFHTEAILFNGGRRFPNGRAWFPVVIPQRV